MADTFKSVSLSKIAKAFAYAHHCADAAPSVEETRSWHYIAKLIWDACGEQKPMPEVLPDNLQALIADDLPKTANVPGGSRKSAPEVTAK